MSGGSQNNRFSLASQVWWMIPVHFWVVRRAGTRWCPVAKECTSVLHIALYLQLRESATQRFMCVCRVAVFWFTDGNNYACDDLREWAMPLRCCLNNRRSGTIVVYSWTPQEILSISVCAFSTTTYHASTTPIVGLSLLACLCNCGANRHHVWLCKSIYLQNLYVLRSHFSLQRLNQCSAVCSIIFIFLVRLKLKKVRVSQHQTSKLSGSSELQDNFDSACSSCRI